MKRSYSARELIQLPPMDAHTAASFARRMLAQFGPYKVELRATKLPKRASELKLALDELTAALAAQQARTKGSRDAVKLDPIVDATWAAIVMFLESWTKLKERPEAQTAQAILDAVFPTGLEFTQRKYPQQWSEANAHIAHLYSKDGDKRSAHTFAEQIEALGGAVFLEEIADKHARFGKALGLTQATDAPKSVDVRTPFDAVLDAAKDFIAAAMQLDDRDIDNSEDVRADLLFVVEEFKAESSAKKDREGEEKPAPEPAPKG